MNVNQDPERAINGALWERSDMRLALAVRDIGSVFRLLKHQGVSQRRIAALTGQSQSEISEILNGRQVMAYDVLARIADGLGIPRAYIGLASDAAADAIASAQHPDEHEEVRRLLSRVAEVTVGAALIDPAAWTIPLERTPAPVPERIGMVDVIRLENITAGLRRLDREHGGGACRDATVAQVHWAQQLLTARCGDEVGRRLHLALADLHNLAGWTSLDVAMYPSARRHFMRALEQARHVSEPSLVAKVLYCLGRLHMHRQMFTDALKFFQLGQLAAQESGYELTVALLCPNEAWTYALLDQRGQALKSVSRAQAEFARADPVEVPTWIRFFGPADLEALVAMTYAFLPAPTPRQRHESIAGFDRSLAARGPDAARNRAFETTALAMVHLQQGDLDHGAAIGHRAVDLAEQVRSIRVVDRLTPLLVEAQRRRGHSDVADLAERIVTLQAA